MDYAQFTPHDSLDFQLGKQVLEIPKKTPQIRGRLTLNCYLLCELFQDVRDFPIHCRHLKDIEQAKWLEMSGRSDPAL